MEEGNQSGDLAISGGHGNAQEEYAMTRRIRMLTSQLVTQLDHSSDFSVILFFSTPLTLKLRTNSS